MDDLIEQRKIMYEDFNEWFYNVCRLKVGGLKNVHDVYPTIDLADAKLSFLDGISIVEYYRTL